MSDPKQNQESSVSATRKKQAGDPERTERLLKAMRAAGLDAVMCTTPTEVRLLTGYWPIFGSSVALLTAEGALHVVVPEDEQELAAQSSAAVLTAYKPEVLDDLTGPVEQLKQPLTELLNSLKLGNATIGLSQELCVQPASYAVMTEFRDVLSAVLRGLAPGAKTMACDDLLERQKAVKTPLELEGMRLAARVSKAGFDAAAGAIRPGLREAEVAAAIQAAFDGSPLGQGFHRSYGFYFCMSGPNSATAAAAYARTRQRHLEAGDLVMIHANTCGDGLLTDITRNWTAGGEVIERHESMRTAITEARKAALAAIRPGVAAKAVDTAARDVMRAHGFDDKVFKHATGHGVGYAAANANALPRIHPASPDILEAGMTFNVEPAAYFEGYGGMRHCDVVAVTADGVEVLTDF